MSVNNNATYATTTAVSVNSTVTDGLSGMSQMRIDPGSGTYGSWIAYAASSAITMPSGDGTKTVNVQYRDNAGNVATLTDTIKLDTTGPTGTMVVNADAAYANATAATINATMTDAGSVVTQMNVDPGTGVYGGWIAYSANYAITLSGANGTKTINVQYRDANNFSATKTDTIVLDTVAPVTTANVTPGNTYSGTQSFTLTPTDAGSGVASTFWQLDSTGGSWTSGTSVSVTAPSSGTVSHTLYWYSRDNATNTEATKSVTFSVAAVVETIPPMTASSFNPASGANYNANTPVTLTASDNVGGSGVKNTYYKIDAGSFTIGTSFSVTGDGLHTFSYYSVDNNNNTETTHVSNQFRIDTTAPVTTSNIVANTTYQGAQGFTLSPTDGGSGVASTFGQLDSTVGAWTSGTSVAVSAPSTGTASHTLYWYSRDNVNNSEATKSVTFSIAAVAVTHGSQTFAVGANQSFVVPSGVTALTVTINGAGGGGGGGDWDTEQDDPNGTDGTGGAASSVVYSGATYVAGGGTGGAGADSWGDPGDPGQAGAANLGSPIGAATGAGYVPYLSATTWAQARGASAGNSTPNTNACYAGANFTNPRYDIYRAFVPFTLPGIPGITGATVTLVDAFNENTTNTVCLFQGTQSNSLANSDFTAFTGPELASRAAGNGNGLGTTFTLNAAGLAYLNSVGPAAAKFCVRNANDVDNVAPTTYHTNLFGGANSYYQPTITLTAAAWTPLAGSGAGAGTGGTGDAAGGDGGAGGRLAGTLTVTPGQTVTVNVGAHGTGGPSGNGAGDATDGTDGSVAITY
jgi:hypothetical protein